MLVVDVTDAAAASDDDCIVVEVKMPPEDLVKKAISLQLPPTFYNYLDQPDCPGCIGCRPLSELRDVEVPSTDAGIYHHLFIAMWFNFSCRNLVFCQMLALSFCIKLLQW